jgi:histidyl-tRNA synthetase
MYTFTDRGGRSLTLRPEATAPVVRAFIEHNLGAGLLPAKLYYFANMFRYERPQAGRYREFWQVGVEALGSEGPEVDAEAIILALDYLESIGVKEYRLLLGSMGDENCRPQYTEKLRRELAGQADGLCEDCRLRLNLNPLRVFDCKNPLCRRTLAAAPKMIDHLCGACGDHYRAVGDLLAQVGVEFIVDPMLVRGFDYYTRTTFEITSPSLGAQNALGGGGRYDRLVADYGGKPTPAVGFALGVERLILAVGQERGEAEPPIPKTGVFLAAVEDQGRPAVFNLATEMRRAGLSAEIDHMSRSLRAQMKAADKLNAEFVVILGPDELAREEAKARRLSTGEEALVALGGLTEWLKERLT